MKAIDNKDYEVAIPILTKVYDQKHKANIFRTDALLERAKAYLATNEKAKALIDLEVYLLLNNDENIRALFLKSGGDPLRLLPERSPQMVLAEFKKRKPHKDMKKIEMKKPDFEKKDEIEDEELEELPKKFEDKKHLLSDRFFKKLQVSAYGELIQEIFYSSKVTFGKDKKSAVLHAKGAELHFTRDIKLNEWKIDDLTFTKNGDFHKKMKRKVIAINSLNLRVFGTALRMFADDYNGAFPKRIGELTKDHGTKYIEQVNKYIEPETGLETESFIYLKGFFDNTPKSASTVLMLAPKAYDGKRPALFIDGHVEVISEEEVKKLKDTQLFLPDRELYPIKLTDAEVKQIHQYIKDLGADHFKVRSSAKKALKKLSFKAVKILKTYTDDENIERRENVKELLKRLSQ